MRNKSTINPNQRSMLLFIIIFFNVILSIDGSIQLKKIRRKFNSQVTKENCVIYDLKVETVFFDKEQTTLQANISWKITKPKGHSVDVRLIPLPMEHCSDKPCVWYGLNSNITNVLLPRDPMPIIEHSDECKIEPGCNYTVYVETTDRSVQQIVKYELADCIGHKCSCKYSHLMPTITLNGTLNSNIFQIAWKLNGSMDNLQMYNIHLDHLFVSVGIQNNTLLTWGGQYIHLQDFQQSFDNENGKQQQHFGFYLVDLNNVTINGSYRLLIGANAFDNRGCSGNYTHFIYTAPAKASNALHANINISLKIMICATLILTLLSVSIVYACLRKQKRLKAAEMAKCWRGFYLNVPSSGVRPSTISFQENVMYDEEILLTHHNQLDDGFFEIPHSSLKFSHNIGRGAFGSVYLAQVENVGGKEGTQIVAVKKLKKNSTIDELEEFFSEINMMKTVSQHPNIVSLIGYCTIKKPMLMVMEYVGCGDLLNYLRKLRHRHEVRSVVVSDNNDEKLRIPQAGCVHNNLIKASNNSYDAIGCYNATNNNINSANTSTTNLSTNTIIHSVNHNLGPVGKYLELFHSPMNSSSFGTGTANSDASYVIRAGSETSKKCDTDSEIGYTMSAQSNEMSTNLPNTDYSFDSTELHSFAIQIARGMRHLEKKQITHRDLAARNILIDENKQLKISDFGLSRTGIYVNTKNKKVPLRWLAIEALRDHLYSTKSDVWSFGIVLWEIGTLGGMPYPSISNAALLSYLLAGKRMQRPEICSQQLYDLMRECWSENPDSRPFFKDIIDRLEHNTVQNPMYVNLDELESTYAFPPTVDDVLNKMDFGEFGETEINVLETATTPPPPTSIINSALI